jgi:hypothetical protein
MVAGINLNDDTTEALLDELTKRWGAARRIKLTHSP